MATARENLINARNKVFLRHRGQGGDLQAERTKPGSNQRSLAHAALRLGNESVPSVTAEDLQYDWPPAGAFDSANKTFVGRTPVQGLNIVVVLQHGGTTTPLIRSDAPSPATGEFYFSMNAPTVIVLGDAPDPGDTIVMVYKPKR
jgi:hypothetical protein